jgi:endonuclease/exonuclease/phosphatase family metal-dependent hydrolase
LLIVTVGTFNLNNLFSRYNFKGEIDAIHNLDTTLDGEILYEFTDSDTWKTRTYMGGLVKGKDKVDTERIAKRIKDNNIDVLAIQEVEDIDTLRQFNREYLNWMYPCVILVEGNDPRLIDVGVLSKLPIGGITSWQHTIHPDDPNQTVFGRDLIQVDILNFSRSKKLFTIFNNHLKSHYIDFREADPAAAENSNNERRRRQAEMVAEIVKNQTRPDSSYIIMGDMNDPPDSPFLKPISEDSELQLTNALSNPKETRPAKPDTPPPSSKSWTHRFKRPRQPAKYELYDQIWLSPNLYKKQIEAWIDRRERHGGDGSDHDPAWVKLQL